MSRAVDEEAGRVERWERPAQPWDDMPVVGHILRVHGLRGQVVIEPETDFPESRFEPGRVVYRAGSGGVAEPLRVASMRLHRGRPIVAFDGIESIEQAEPLARTELRVPDEALEPLPANAFYQHDLVGCRVDTAEGRQVGTVERVEGDGGASRLVVTGAGGEVLVPLAADICVMVDVAAKSIVIRPPEGLLELNEPSHRAADRREAWRSRNGRTEGRGGGRR